MSYLHIYLITKNLWLCLQNQTYEQAWENSAYVCAHIIWLLLDFEF